MVHATTVARNFGGMRRLGSRAVTTSDTWADKLRKSARRAAVSLREQAVGGSRLSARGLSCLSRRERVAGVG